MLGSWRRRTEANIPKKMPSHILYNRPFPTSWKEGRHLKFDADRYCMFPRWFWDDGGGATLSRKEKSFHLLSLSVFSISCCHIEMMPSYRHSKFDSDLYFSSWGGDGGRGPSPAPLEKMSYRLVWLGLLKTHALKKLCTSYLVHLGRDWRASRYFWCWHSRNFPFHWSWTELDWEVGTQWPD